MHGVELVWKIGPGGLPGQIAEGGVTVSLFHVSPAEIGNRLATPDRSAGFLVVVGPSSFGGPVGPRCAPTGLLHQSFDEDGARGSSW
jgi:hypothetical protein